MKMDHVLDACMRQGKLIDDKPTMHASCICVLYCDTCCDTIIQLCNEVWEV